MISFTCNICNKSLKLSWVKKHYESFCKSEKSLKCNNCQRDFKGKDYASHTMCLNEEQLNKAAMKGHVKQKTWNEYIQSILKKPDISSSTKALLSKISKCTNIPRKKIKFVNFVRNSKKSDELSIVEDAWNTIEKYRSEYISKQSGNNSLVGEETYKGKKKRELEPDDKQTSKKIKNDIKNELELDIKNNGSHNEGVIRKKKVTKKNETGQKNQASKKDTNVEIKTRKRKHNDESGDSKNETVKSAATKIKKHKVLKQK